MGIWAYSPSEKSQLQMRKGPKYVVIKFIPEIGRVFTVV